MFQKMIEENPPLISKFKPEFIRVMPFAYGHFKHVLCTFSFFQDLSRYGTDNNSWNIFHFYI